MGRSGMSDIQKLALEDENGNIAVTPRNAVILIISYIGSLLTIPPIFSALSLELRVFQWTSPKVGLMCLVRMICLSKNTCTMLAVQKILAVDYLAKIKVLWLLPMTKLLNFPVMQYVPLIELCFNSFSSTPP